MGPILWLLYVNDIINGIESEILLFADDTCCFASGIDPAETALIINRDLELISNWAKKWKLSFNTGKSKDVIFSENKVLFNSPPLIFNNSFVERVHEHKHLGIFLSSTLSWSRQIHETCLKANRKLAVLRSVKYLKRATLDILYKVCVRSTIEYGLVLYWHTLKQTEAARLTQIQYRAARVCTGALMFTNQSRLEKDLSWESIAERVKFLGLGIFHKIHLNLTRPLIKSCMPEINTNNTRASGSYKRLPFKSKKYSDSFFPKFSQLWSSLPKSLKEERDFILFKTQLKSNFKPKKQKHFNLGNKLPNTLLCRLRVGRSFLKSHGFAINLSLTDKCICGDLDTIENYFLNCFFFKTERLILLAKINLIYPPFSKLSKAKQCNILLYGINLNNLLPDPRNRSITFAVQEYITKTNRFSKHYE